MAAEVVEQGIRTGEWLTIFATLVGPILAVQVQKLVEAGRSKRDMKESVFRRLMATRGARLSAEHVQALNMIDIAFYGVRVFSFHWQSAAEKEVRRRWRDYFDSLEIDNTGWTESQSERLIESRYEKFNALLSSIAIAQNYDFDPVELRRNIYSPNAHGTIDAENNAIRSGLSKVLNGASTIKMDVVSFPGGASANGDQGQSVG